jgi:ABC-type branched-subunit amino acid transport system substrate-binding protein
VPVEGDKKEEIMGRSARILRGIGMSLGTLSLGAGLIVATAGSANASPPPLKVGILGTLSLPGGEQPFAGVAQAVKARFAAQNKLGGVDGRKIEIVDTLDDQGTPASNAADQVKLVESDHVNAVIVYSLFIGGGFVPGFCNYSATYGFSIVGCGNSALYGGTENLGQTTKLLPKGAPKTVAIVTEDQAGQVAGAKTVSTEFKHGDWDVCTVNTTVSPTATDVTPYAQQVVTSCGGKQPSAIMNILDYTPISMTAAEKALGYKGIIMNFTTHVPAYLQSAQTAATLDGTYEQDYGVGGPETSPKAFAVVERELKAVGATYEGLGSAEGWASADQYIKILQKVGANASDEKIEEAMNKGTTLPGVAGIYAPSKWPFQRNAPVPCGSIVKVVGNQFKGVDPLKCFSTFKVSS